jgi:hypothetical protein
MAEITWTGTVSDDFNTADNWNPQSVPGMADDAVIGITAAVATFATDMVNSLAMVATASLSINGGEFIILDGSGATGLAGTIDVNNATALSLTGVFTNSGTVNVAATTSTADIIVGTAGATLQGGGQLLLSNNTNNFNNILGTSTTSTLTNVDNMIAGAGHIGGGELTLINETKGVIDAD